MARRGINKKGSKYSNANRVRNKIKRLTKHLKTNPQDNDAKKALNIVK
jgi:ribosomal protein S15P/S13E